MANTPLRPDNPVCPLIRSPVLKSNIKDLSELSRCPLLRESLALGDLISELLHRLDNIDDHVGVDFGQKVLGDTANSGTAVGDAVGSGFGARELQLSEEVLGVLDVGAVDDLEAAEHA